ncbi:hypothetical protein [Stutzerimonas nitrititolerans]|uniref:hypothetical protein n=1 Tax=Stutzerimonas nitrititolerans TaxID=2482751 RepID=UPI002897F332|nr:hypothetical protein [Stutzerimonas nitrititolerans]
MSPWPIASLLPHAGDMILIDDVLAHDADGLTARAVVRPGPYSLPDGALPPWLDAVLRKAVHPNPARRYGELSEFLHDLRQPPPDLLQRARAPLLQRNPLRFWQTLAWVQMLMLLVLSLW